MGSQIFDISNMICPLCKKTHSVKRVGFNLYEMVCYVCQKQFDMVLNNYNPKKYYNWHRWLK
jgi:hypothetical protein